MDQSDRSMIFNTSMHFLSNIDLALFSVQRRARQFNSDSNQIKSKTKSKQNEMDELKENRSPQSDCKDEDLSILMTKKLELIHPLEHQWTFWYLKNQQGKDWNDNLMKLATFGHVEEFWAFVLFFVIVSF